MQYPVALDFIDTMQTLSTVDAVWNSLLSFTKRYGFSQGVLIDMPAPGRRVEEAALCITWPDEWRHRYLAEDYLKCDPAVLHLMRSREPYTWQDVMDCPEYTKLQRRVVNEAAEFGLDNGLIVPLFGMRSGTTIASFAGANTDLSVRERAELHLIAIYAHARIRALLPHREPASFPGLSPRERECLQWVSAGKTDWEIGEILSISEKTANAHIERVKQKYNVATRVQAVVLALRAGEIQI